jgi:hypothetical protein
MTGLPWLLEIRAISKKIHVAPSGNKILRFTREKSRNLNSG